MCSPIPPTAEAIAGMIRWEQQVQAEKHQRDAAENQARLERLASDHVKVIARSTCAGCGAPVQRHESSCSYCKRPA